MRTRGGAGARELETKGAMLNLLGLSCLLDIQGEMFN